MFNLFKRTRIAEWEKALLIAIFSQLPEQYKRYKEQVEADLLNRVRFEKITYLYTTPIINYVGFSYNPIVSKFENRKAQGFRLDGISVFDLKLNDYTPFRIHAHDGLVTGYETPESKDFTPDISRIKIENLKEFYFENTEVKKELLKFLTKEEVALLDVEEVYPVDLNGKTYYHLIDLEDGDFIGIDTSKKIYKVTHDPLGATLIEKSLKEVINNY